MYTNKDRVGEISLDPLDDVPRDKIHIESLFPDDGTIVGFCSRVVCAAPLLPSPWTPHYSELRRI